MKFLVGISTVIALLFGGCSTISSVNDGTGTGELSGEWKGSWTSSSTNKEGSIKAKFLHTNSILSGAFSLKDSPCMNNGTIYGTVSGGSVDMLIKGDGNTFKLNTTKDSNSNIKGTYNITSGKCKGSSGKVLLTQLNNTYKVKENTSNILSNTWDNLNTQVGQNSWDTKLYRLGEALSNMGTPYSQRGVAPSYRWMADEPDSGFNYSDYNRMSEQNKTDRKIKELEKKIEDSTFGYMSGNQMYSKSNKYMGYIKNSNLYNKHNQKTGYIRGNGIYSNSGKYLGYTR